MRQPKGPHRVCLSFWLSLRHINFGFPVSLVSKVMAEIRHMMHTDPLKSS